MKAIKPVVLLRRRADEEILRAAVDYFTEGGAPLEGRFIDAVEAALAHIAQWPATGSLRYAALAQRQGLRFWQTKRFI